MKLTPLDIRHKEFKRGMRGYQDAEVDEFLDEVADEYERLFKENIDLRERVESLEEKVAGYVRIEETLQKTLVNAQASAEEQKQNATKQAQLILQDAELKARQLVNEAYTERQTIEQSMAKLRNAEDDFRFKFGQLLEGYQRQLQDPAEVGASAPEDDLTRHTEAIKEAIARESKPERIGATGDATPDRAATASAATDAAPAEEPRGAADPPAEADGEERVGTTAPGDRPAAARPLDTSPSLGRGGIQAGTPQSGEHSTGDASDDAAVTASTPAPTDSDGEQPQTPSVGDDLLADVDTGVNEDEFNW